MIKISFHKFWPGFNKDENFFVEMMKKRDNVCVTDVSHSDVVFVCENYIPNDINRNKTKVVSFMPEPKQVDYSNENIDYYLSFDPTNYELKNIRLPLWFLYINFFDLKNQENPIPVVTPENILSNEWYNKEKTKFCAAPYSAVNRVRLIMHQILNSYKKTDGFGLPHGNGDRVRNEIFKYNFISDYRFCMTAENTMKTGYITEKLFHAKTAGCIPIFWGDSEYVKNDFNPECFIDISDFNNVDEFMNHVKKIDQDDDLYRRISSAPLFNYNVEEKLSDVINEFFGVFDA